eukprot:gene33129-40881_t
MDGSGIRVERLNKPDSFIFDQIKSHIPYSPTSCTENTQKSASMELLLSQQRAKHGIDMYDNITMQNRSELDSLIAHGTSYDEAVLMMFDNYTTHFDEEEPEVETQTEQPFSGLKSQSMDAYCPNRPFKATRALSDSPRGNRLRSKTAAGQQDCVDNYNQISKSSSRDLDEEERDNRERCSRPVSLSRRNPFAQGRTAVISRP